MTARHRWSLQRNLSIRLAVQTFTGIAILSAVIYVTTAIHLNSRQQDSLGNKFGIVQHLLFEANRTTRIKAFCGTAWMTISPVTTRSAWN